MEIPEGYVLVPKLWAEKYFIRAEWQEIENPTISELSIYLGISKEKIKKDLKYYDCPLRKFSSGAKGRGYQMRFIKCTVKFYEEWLTNKKIVNL
ncbi:hypothetical protein ASG31_14110 [Chryseobacterium sp. Leaf404]|uniref:hypothetical protein n=1 Tax=unclassified Chryseobacterium TaxID=2593645 RepID=UPI0006F71A57|nr:MULTISPECIES: hypothetical protein [unclassified Chryseobacterium]KQT16102.1 hypothetical protein ASG31_14110 [Chryseobacterium sp. Leaf404]